MPGFSLLFGLSVVGTGAWVVALISAAIALRHAGISRGPFILLILAGVFLLGGHPFPAGTLAFGCFFLATAWLELTRSVATGGASGGAGLLGFVEVARRMLVRGSRFGRCRPGCGLAQANVRATIGHRIEVARLRDTGAGTSTDAGLTVAVKVLEGGRP